MRDDAVTYINALFVVYTLIILIRILLSWIPTVPVRRVWRAVYDFIHQSTDWFLGFFRRIIPPMGIIDLSPIVALIVLYILQRLVVELILSI
ncbi:MAG: YggT family protein [Actinomycetota bacterium]